MQTSDNLAEIRFKICEACPLFKEQKNMGPVCDNSKWINLDGETSRFPKKGFTRGCGCKLKLATKQIAHHCPIKKW